MGILSARKPVGDWRQAMPKEMRKVLTKDVYEELVRITGGENDKRRVWGSAAKFESKLWLESTDPMTYMSKLEKKIASLKKMVQLDAGEVPQQAPPQHQQVQMTPQVQMTAAAGMFQNPVNMTNFAPAANAAGQPASNDTSMLQAAQPNNQVTAAQALAAQKFQQQLRALSRQNSMTSVTPGAASTAASAPASSAPAANAAGQPAAGDALSYGDKIKQLKAKYWDDLVVVCREFTRKATQMPAGESQQALQQQKRINFFLQNLKRIMTLLNQDPAKLTTNNRSDLDRVELFIERQVMLILSRLKSDKAKQREDPAKTETPAPATGPTAAELQRQTLLMQQAAQLEAQRQNQVAQDKMGFLSARKPVGDWRQAMPKKMRIVLAKDVYEELVRIYGASDKRRVWRSAAKFESKLWLESTDPMTYMSKLEKKIASLKKKVQRGAAGVPQQAPPQQQQQQVQMTPQAQMAAAAGMFQNLVNKSTSAANAAGQPASNDTLSYEDKIKQIKAKCFDQLVVMCREYTRMATQMSTGVSQEIVKLFLQDIKGIMALFERYPAKCITYSRSLLDRLDLHLEGLMSDKANQLLEDLAKIKTPAPSSTPAELQRQTLLEAHRQNQVAQRKAAQELLLKAQQPVKVEAENQQQAEAAVAATAAIAAADQERKDEEVKMETTMHEMHKYQRD